ncbi:HNH endonuclease [Dysgonomonas capnocytophagoides]|uniref:HNH endonuclease n=1 Tax=Dysgonomonas capnocytophagoides TaxID=45254 RepID=A0A4Y8KUP8_9BACT|nr:HNH endonuclease [Dysgonomonas capnocytophagoides]TFD92161.1 HNH endonuclease [Dysgonomonas capnocytophagoides]
MIITSRNIQHYLNVGSAKYIDEAEMYLVTIEGDIYSLHNRNKGEPRKLKLTISDGGYSRVRIYVDGEVKRLLVHRVVAEAFIPNPKNYPTVNHRDENSCNNRMSNLEWCTQKYNNNYGTRNDRISETTGKKIAQIGLDGNIVKIWRSTNEVTKQGYNQGAVSACARGELPSHKGYKWTYVINQ